ncbi:L-serine ammonia-lyase, iron-sulfur-dependent subunit beta [Caldibacillus lycopersici]|uniref:L-serine deaminase n=1 Tax=Perspicuibacillus lycopersici TaxID=1325689 RepID=A0AAE3LLY4_9BACI|nr:L-serine ammonia-lyase, iron-sulfur-dependent subunit beta [Perspicuibacillus lycopersici]MCU9612147.1 L-serine ammonia-lyase, iron-sulfur-dependent subunit beta [Perspicuibacillus lycopersici]
MKFRSVFDIIGPVMIGPSSSHTAGAARIGRVARNVFGRQPKWAHVHLYGSFAETYRGHGTDVAIVGGLLDYDTFDERIIQAMEIAAEQGLEVKFFEEKEVPEHPNTARLVIGDDEGELELVGLSIGGGKIEIDEINGFKLKLTGENPAIIVVNNDRFGCIASVANVLATYEINIGHMEVSRKEKGKLALMVLETDETVDQEVMDAISKLPNILQVARIVE